MRDRAPRRDRRCLLPAASVPESFGLHRVHFPVEPGFGGPPLALDGFRGDAHDFAGLLHVEAGEETQLDDAALPWIDPGQPLQGLIAITSSSLSGAIEHSSCSSTLCASLPPRLAARARRA